MKSHFIESFDSRTRICVPICVDNLGELERCASRAADVADVIELRVDCLGEQDVSAFVQGIEKLIGRLSVPLIITFRATEEGGYRTLTINERKWFWQSIKPSPDVLFDIEYHLSTTAAVIRSFNIICSHHHFGGVPEDLERLYERLAATPARVLKIVVYADDTVDCLPIFRLLERAQKENRKLIAHAMGAAGLATRILGPSRGAFLTYAALEEDSGTAPGQITADQMRSLYRIERINKQTRVFGLVGSPVMHSISPHVHNAAFEAEGIDAVYLPFEVKDLKAFIERMVRPASRDFQWQLGGLSITAPHKLAVMEYLDSIDERAREIGAVNTIVIEGDKLHGYNTDVEGFIESLSTAIHLTPDSRLAVVGAGGAANAALWSLKQQGVEVVLFARDVNKARPLIEKFGVSCQSLDGASFEGFDVVVNATPLGSLGARQAQTPATASQLFKVKLAYDLVYNPIETRFMSEAKAAGCKTLGGVEMLVAQARRQFKLWTGKDAPADVMRTAALRGLKKDERNN
jgi:3-dehydroquinate dehydratase / shikimate dehydrogenase